MTERDLVLAIQHACNDRGLLWHHCPDSRRCEGTRGFPDLFIAGAGGVLPIEVKSPYGDTSAEQDRWIWTLHHNKLLTPVVRPGEQDIVEAMLDKLA